jgi:hypothetical protein
VSVKKSLTPYQGKGTAGTALMAVEHACRWLAEAKSVDDVKALKDRAEAVRVYAKQRDYSLSAQNDAAEIRLRCERRLGELLKETPKQRPGDYKRLNGSTVPPSLADLGISKDDSSRWQRVAGVPEGDFEAHVAQVRQAQGELTTRGVLDLARQLGREEVARQRRAKRAAPVNPPEQSDRWQVVQGDCLRWLATLPAGHADLVLFSPPYEDRRTYGIGFNLKGQDWVDWLVPRFQAALRVCRGLVACVVDGPTKDYKWSATPFLLGAALHRAGVCLREPPVYKRYGIPGSGGADWLRGDYEHVICATNGGPLPWSDNTALGHPPKAGDDGRCVNDRRGSERDRARGNGSLGYATPEEVARLGPHRARLEAGRRPGRRRTQGYTDPDEVNPGNVIDCGVVGGFRMGDDLAHDNEAPFAERLVEFFVRSFCPPGGLVLDPMCGSGTTGAVAVRWGRRFRGCDIRPGQVELSRRRIAAVTWAEALTDDNLKGELESGKGHAEGTPRADFTQD